MPTQAQPLVAVLSPSHSTSFFTSTVRTCNWSRTRRTASRIRCSSGLADEAAVGVMLARSEEKPEEDIKLKATVTIYSEGAGYDWFTDHVIHRKLLLLEIFSSELEQTGQEKPPFSTYASCSSSSPLSFEATFEATFTVPASFGPVGAVLVVNEHHSEIFIKSMVVAAAADHSAPVTFDCNSWVHPKSESPAKRTFFPLKSYLPSQTPKGVQRLRWSELAAIRGDGQGERKSFERIYDYDVYNDLGDPDRDADTKRPVLGGKDHPYPRRCRTGRPRSQTDPSSEVRHNDPLYVPYVPRDEAFSFTKRVSFGVKTFWSALHAVRTLENTSQNASLSFPSFAAIDALFNLEKQSKEHALEQLRDFITQIKGIVEYAFSFEQPELIKRNKFAWIKDEEFGRETLAGMNPLSIQLVTEFPFVSKLDEETYGTRDSLITKELIEDQIHGVMTAEQAVQSKKLFILDYHDMFLPYVNKVREQDGTTLYGSRTLFFLTDEGTLHPIAIELTRPKAPTKPQWRQVFTPGRDATGSWLWMLAKAHVLAHDTGYHQLVSHWLRTHCCVEPYIIAANRQLSRMHPIYRLLHPHFRYTMEINARARQQLINAGGVIESTFSPGKYCMELSSVVYDKLWRFDMEALPADLIRRGMAVEHDAGKLELTIIKDYPFANDGLLVWDSIKKWASDYVTHYYPSAEDITGDEELQSWWTEVRTKGHADKKDEPWWPVLDSHDNLVQVLTTIMWVTSGHHAAVNFGQYPYAGYFPNRPTIARKNMPVEDGLEEMEAFWNNPEKVLLDVFPSQLQAVKVMMVLDGLSTHSPDEEYMGKHAEPAWEVDPIINSAFERFRGRMKEIEGTIDRRNWNIELRNRCGAGVMPYELLKPFSGPGVTGKGIPNSISI